MQPLIITDIETGGLDFRIHDIIEIGALKVDSVTLNEIDIFEQRIRPKRPMTKEAMDINGYKWICGRKVG
jgi:DNA polymerase III alpha subunit (gram-positive type)